MIKIFDHKNILTKYGYILCFIFIIIGISILYYLYFNVSIEKFNDPLPTPNKLSSQIPDGEDYLYPVYSLNETCESRGLIPSFVNKLCLIDDKTYKPLANCKCEDKDGYCKICYPEVKIDRKGRSVIYNANKLES
jgi:hypothetical protein